MQANKKLGNKGEALVAAWLEQRGVTILARNYRTNLGEVDLIVSKNETIAFVEVKTRSTAYFAISQTVTLSKQKKIIKAAHSFILKNNIRNKILRFDVATILCQQGSCRINYIPNAFQTSS